MNITSRQKWIQHKENPHIEKNSLTNKYRCTTCKLELGTNAGGVSSHSQAVHNMRLDGRPLKQPEASSENKTVGNYQEFKNFSSRGLSDIIRYDKPSGERQSEISDTQRSFIEELRRREKESVLGEQEKKLCIWKKIEIAENQGVPQKLLVPWYEELGLDPNYKEKKRKEREEELQRKKHDDLKRKFMILFCVADNYKAKRTVICWYILNGGQF